MASKFPGNNDPVCIPGMVPWQSPIESNKSTSKACQRLTVGLAIFVAVYAIYSPSVFAQATVAWPSGIFFLAVIFYVAIVLDPPTMWSTEPSVGLFLGSGLPHISIPTMQKAHWLSSNCHFVSGIRTAHGRSNFWLRSEDVSSDARAQALEKALKTLRCIVREPPNLGVDESLWHVNSAGLLEPAKRSLSTSQKNLGNLAPPSSRDFLLFAALDYHVFWGEEVRIEQEGKMVFSTEGMDSHSVIDVESVDMALLVAAAHLVRRPHFQSIVRALASKDEAGSYILQLEQVPRDRPVCSIDFHSYASLSSNVSATLDELAGAYFRVVQYLKRSASVPMDSSSSINRIAHINVGQTAWIAILGGATLDKGRLTIQNLPGWWTSANMSAGTAYLSRVETILELLEPHVDKSYFGDIIYSNGLSRSPAIPYFLLGLFAQIIMCYFLSTLTPVGVWASVAISNTFLSGHLTDWHSMYFGKTQDTYEPGMKMRIPGHPSGLMAVTTFDRTPPRLGDLQPGFFLNIFGLAAAVLGTVFQQQTREALGFAPLEPLRPAILYTAVGLTVGLSVLLTVIFVVQGVYSKAWNDLRELPNRWMAYSTIPVAFLVGGLAILFREHGWVRFWPVLDVLTCVSGLPLGMIENGRTIGADGNIMQMILLTRWLMGSVASVARSSG